MCRKWFIVACIAIVGCNQSSAPSVPAGQSSSVGWDVRYNAALALARRGSPKFSDAVVQDLFKEMLDEEQQLRNFRTTLKNGKETTDAVAARTAVLGALKALDDYKAKQPGADLTALQPAIEKLATSTNPVLSQEARKLLDSFRAR